jgi:hypothetical protein
MPSDNGFIGRECKNPECKKYFKVLFTSLKDKMFCPYCATLFDKSELITNDQLDYVREAGMEKARAYMFNKLRDIFKEATRGNKGLRWKPGNTYIPKAVSPNYLEKKVDSELECFQCKAVFQVYGTFGYCPSCKCDNSLIYDTNMQLILKEIEGSTNKDRALRHAYNDLVSTFENFCKNKNTSDMKYNFQNLENAKLFFQDHFSIDMLQGLSLDEVLSIKRIFQKRHVYQHNRGIVDQRYINIIAEDSNLLNMEAPLTREEFIKGSEAMRKILVKII